MTPEDQAAFEAAYKAYSESTIVEWTSYKWTGMKLFYAGLAHRDAQAAQVNAIYSKVLEKIATVNAMDYEYQRWAKEAIAAAEALKG